MSKGQDKQTDNYIYEHLALKMPNESQWMKRERYEDMYTE